jgi:hypothetical protein
LQVGLREKLADHPRWSSAAVGARGRYRDTSLWWGLWIAYQLLANYADNLVFKEGLLGSDVDRGVVPALEIGVAILGSLAFAAWVPVVPVFRV